ncbi:hypothetical protein [Actinomadura hibisca]|uniref:hypothetical protein n=1 Tax=Actinomadura hibisca TaxID=68565 RepID=UPI00082E6050|nr:hypothetical protein [Actinomadura hibisca]
MDAGLTITAVSKWYHRRTVNILKTLLPGIGRFHAISWEPRYAEKLVTRQEWPHIPDGKRRVIREWEEVTQRISDGSLREVVRVDGAWS